MPVNKLRITLDITPIIYSRGVSRYTSNLILSLIKQPDITVQFFGSTLRQKQVLQSWIQTHSLQEYACSLHSLPPKALSFLWYTLNKPQIERMIPQSEVFHAWEELIPPAKKTQVISTIHDLAVLKYPQTVHPSTLYKHTQAYKRIKETNSHVLTVSKSTYQDIIDLLELPKQNVHLVYEALPRESKIQLSEEESRLIIQKLKLSKPYLLFVGTPEPRKNLLKTLKAWKTIKQELDFVVVGAVGWKDIEQELVREGVRRFTNLSSQTVAALYKKASAFLFPSLYEGFGLPILESYYHQIPVITSNRGAMLEIGGSAAELVEPESVESIATGISNVLTESNEKRNRRIQAMKLRLQLFHWKTTAEKTITVYKSLVK